MSTVDDFLYEDKIKKQNSLDTFVAMMEVQTQLTAIFARHGMSILSNGCKGCFMFDFSHGEFFMSFLIF